MSFIYILMGLTTLFIFLFKREWLLDKRSYPMIFAINLFLFLLGYLFENKRMESLKNIEALKMPLIAQIIFIVMVFVFRKLYNRDPVDTFWSMDIRLLKDGIFNFIFFVLAVVVPAFLVFSNIL